MEAKEEQEKIETELKQATITMQVAPQSFPDVPGWAQESVYYLVHKKLFLGCQMKHFHQVKY